MGGDADAAAGNSGRGEQQEPEGRRRREELLEEAEKDLTTALELTDEADEGWIYFMRGVVRRELELTDDALDDFQTVLQSQQPPQQEEEPKREKQEEPPAPPPAAPTKDEAEAGVWDKMSQAAHQASSSNPPPLPASPPPPEEDKAGGGRGSSPNEEGLAEEGWSLRAEAGYALAQTLMAQGRTIEATASLEDVIDACPSHVEATVHLARCKAALGDEKAPVMLMEAALRSHPEDPKLLVHAGDIAALQGRSQDAIGLYGQAIHVAERLSHRGKSSARDALPGYRQRGKLSLGRGKFREALMDLRKVVNLKASGRDGLLDRDVTAALTGALTHGEFKACVLALGPFIQRAEKAKEPPPSQIYSLADLYTYRCGQL